MRRKPRPTRARRRANPDQLEPSFPSFEQQLMLPIRRLLHAPREVVSKPTHLDGRGTRAALERARFFDAKIDPMDHRVNTEQHCAHLLGRHFDQVIMPKVEQRDDLMGDLVIVDGQADAAGAPRLRHIGV
jgi:hypothetical protein